MVCNMGILTGVKIEFSKVFTYKTPISVIKQIPNIPHLELNKPQTQMNNAKTGQTPWMENAERIKIWENSDDTE